VPGDVAIIDHADLDRIAAEDLAASGVRAVVNVAPFSTGRYPNAGPLVLAQAGVRLIDAPAAPLFEELRDGDPVVITGGEVHRNGTVLAAGRELAAPELAEQLEAQRERVVLGGEVPSPLHPPQGCAFHPRCPIAVEECHRIRPDLRDLGAGHEAACHLA